MRKSMFAGAAAILALSGCAASIPPVEVTRFHTSDALTPAVTTIDAPETLEATSFRAAVSRDLSALGYRQPLGADAASWRAKLSWTRTFREERKPSPFSIGIGGGTGGRNIGVGVGTSIPIGGGMRKIVVTELFVQLIRAADGKPLWEGRAITAAPENAPASQGGLVADKLSKALFAGFPGESGKTILVK